MEEKLNMEIFTADQKTLAGVMAHLAHDGTVTLTQGLIRPEDREAAIAAGLCSAETYQIR